MRCHNKDYLINPEEFMIVFFFFSSGKLLVLKNFQLMYNLAKTFIIDF